MPQNPAIVATKTASGIVNIFDTQTFPALPPSESVHKTLELTGHDAEGYGLDWSLLQNGYLASGSDDCKICCWDIRGSTAPLRSYARACVIEVSPAGIYHLGRELASGAESRARRGRGRRVSRFLRSQTSGPRFPVSTVSPFDG